MRAAIVFIRMLLLSLVCLVMMAGCVGEGGVLTTSNNSADGTPDGSMDAGSSDVDVNTEDVWGPEVAANDEEYTDRFQIDATGEDAEINATEMNLDGILLEITNRGLDGEQEVEVELTPRGQFVRNYDSQSGALNLGWFDLCAKDADIRVSVITLEIQGEFTEVPITVTLKDQVVTRTVDQGDRTLSLGEVTFAERECAQLRISTELPLLLGSVSSLRPSIVSASAFYKEQEAPVHQRDFSSISWTFFEE